MKEKKVNIDILEEFIKQGGYQKNGMPISYIEILYPLLRQAISNLISENKELKEKNRQAKMRIVKLENEISARIEDVNTYYIPKSKVEAKIEEVSNGTYDAKIVLQSLLEKE